MTERDVSAALTDSVWVARVTRGGVVESMHRGSAVITSPDGDVEVAVGSPDAPVFPRSATKPIQLLAMVRHGLATNGPHLAVGASSHSGEPFHLTAVREILTQAGLGAGDLQNTPDYPYADAARIQWIQDGLAKASIAQNCSGKHASMLATCVANGWDTGSYLDEHHPLQGAITETVAELCGPVSALVVDGCGAPAHAVPLSGLARAFGRIAAATDGPERTVADALRAHPEFLGGTGRDVTALVAGLPGAIAKDGAEAVYGVGLPDGRGIAVKIADGGQRARPVVVAALLWRLGIDAPDAIAALEDQPVLGHGRPVGRVEALPL